MSKRETNRTSPIFGVLRTATHPDSLFPEKISLLREDLARLNPQETNPSQANPTKPRPSNKPALGKTTKAPDPSYRSKPKKERPVNLVAAFQPRAPLNPPPEAADGAEGLRAVGVRAQGPPELHVETPDGVLSEWRPPLHAKQPPPLPICPIAPLAPIDQWFRHIFL